MSVEVWLCVTLLGEDGGGLGGRPQRLGFAMGTGCSRFKCAGLSRSTVMITLLPSVSTWKVFGLGYRTLKGPSYGCWRGVW